MKEEGRWGSVERVYHDALERPHAERAAFIASACGGDEALRREVESLLEHAEHGFLEESALDVAARAIGPEGTESLVGRRLGSYEVLALVGAGGMGEVYRARDSVLDREVALKRVSRAFVADPGRLARLEHEARMLASLNHPGIATLYGLEQIEGQRFLVMELVTGQTLAERLERGSLPLAEALGVGRQMAEALEAAHESGVVHRDLKPANVGVTPEGRVKLLDFGLAKALAGTTSEVATTPADGVTREGTVLGTPAYMSPEQARGQAVDRRTDVWAWGCCLYESLVGRRAFAGDSSTDTLAAVQAREPDWDALPETTPEAVRKLIRRCLTKDARQRLQHIGDARVELGDVEVEPAAGVKPQPVVARGVTFSRSSRMVLAGAVLGALAAGVASLFWHRTLGGQPSTPSASPVTRFTLRLDDEAVRDHRLAVDNRSFPLALSPDGAWLGILARGPQGLELLLRELSAFETRLLPGSLGASDPFLSPDGRWLGFWRWDARKLFKVSTGGGPPIGIAPMGVPTRAMWSEDDEILVQTARLWSVPVAGGPAREVPIRDLSEDEWVVLQGRVPGRSDLLVASYRLDETIFEVLSRGTGRRRRLLRGGRLVSAWLTRTRHPVFASGDSLIAAPMDMERLEPLGNPVPVLHGIGQARARSLAALSETGTLVYLAAERVRPAELVSLDREGKATTVPYVDFVTDALSVSPGGRQVAAQTGLGATPGVWVIDLERGSKRLLAGGAVHPLYSRDGVFVTYLSSYGPEFVYARRRADGTGDEERLFTHFASWSNPVDWSPDGRSLLFVSYSGRGDADVWVYSGGDPAPLLASPFNEWSARFSPDGRFIAYDTDEGGDNNVYLRPFPGPGPRTTVSVGGGHRPRWGPDGRLFFEGGSEQGQKKMMVADVETTPILRVGRPRELYEMDKGWGLVDVMPDGRFFVFRGPRTVEGPIELNVIVNWFAELERLAPHPSR